MRRIMMDKKTKTALFSSIFFMLIAHGYRWANAMYNHDSLLIVQNDQRWQISLGRIFNPVYVLFRGEIAAPLLVGFLGSLFLAAAVILIVRILNLTKQISIILCAGILTTFETLAFLNASFVNFYDIYMLSLLLAVSSACLLLQRRGKFIYPGAILCSVLSLGLYQCYTEVTVILILISLLRELLDGARPVQVVKKMFRAILVLLTAGILYYICLKVIWHVTGIPSVNTYNGLVQISEIRLENLPSLIGKTWIYPFRYFLDPEMAHRVCSAVIHVILLIISLISMWKIAACRKLSKSCILTGMLLLLLMPLGANAVFFLTSGFKHGLMTYAFSFYTIWAVMLYDLFLQNAESSLHVNVVTKYGVPFLCGILVLNHVIFSNQLYVKKDLETQASLSAMTRILTEMENTDGYSMGSTRVAILGDFSENPISKGRTEFDFVHDYFVGTLNTMTVSYYNTYEWYFNSVLGYPVNLVPISDLPQYFTDPRVQSMPVFPGKGSVAMIDDTLVIRLSEQLEPQDMP